MSTSSKPRSRAQAHQNTVAFKHNKNSKLSRKLETVPTGGLCKRCAEKIEWRKKYRKYKPLSAPRKCNKCGQKKIKAAYRTLCVDCAAFGKVCENCGEQKHVEKYVSTPAEEAQEFEAMQSLLDGLRERDKRTILRRHEKGEDVYQVIKEYVEIDDDEDDYEDDDEEE